MTTSDRDSLQGIKCFDQLVKYLRDKLDWPIDGESFDDLTFDYEPEELGIDMKTAAKIQEIKQLRPLISSQPWGIFFVKFEPKRLPVVALRRLLSQLVIKRRASSHKAEQPAWHLHDLLFISNYGEGEQRQITFAHFSQDESKDDLPTLKVLGWDNLDTPLHIDHVAEILTERLTWPDDETDVANWRKSWGSAFTLRHREVIDKSKDLAVRLAVLARAIRDRIRTVLAIETKNGPLTKLLKAFQESLIHDLDADGFADMYAQTIAYGLLSARLTNPKANTADGFASQLPVTNPFLKELMETFLLVGGRKGRTGRSPGIDFDELGVSEVVELLDDTNMEAVIRDFGDRNQQEDPVIHFYELFLKEYDAKKRMQRGAFYTPQPVVSYIICSVHKLLQTEFGLEDGLASTVTWGEMANRHSDIKIPVGTAPDSPFVMILDIATGTGTFLVETINVIYKTMTAKWEKQGKREQEINKLWNEYVPEHLLPRLYGYELMMAPYAIAHMKIGLKLFETGYKFMSDERVRVYLTNSLEPPSDAQQQLVGILPALAHEAAAVNAVKQTVRFTVVVGNPPYAGFSSNMNPWIDGLLHGIDAVGSRTANYYEVDGKPLAERKLWLQDDYIKFIRLSQHLIESSGIGIHGFITNSSFLDGPTHRGMRFQIMRYFSRVSILNLHGSLKRNQDAADVALDVNVFDIQQGVTVSLYTRNVKWSGQVKVEYCELRGPRADKYERLLARAIGPSTPLGPCGPWYLFVPTTVSDSAEYLEQLSVRDIFRVKSTSVQTSRDDFVIDFSRSKLTDRIALLGTEVPDKLFRDDYGLEDGRNWKLSAARQDIRSSGKWKDSIHKYLYRTFDVREIIYRDSLINWPRHEVMDQLDGSNIALIVPRQLAGQEFRHVFCTRIICDMCVVSTATKEAVQAHPLFLSSAHIQRTFMSAETETNFTDVFKNQMKRRLGITCKEKADAEICFRYIYAILHSPEYRKRYAEFLKIDFPRVPLTSSLDLFRSLGKLGGELVALHLLESPTVSNFITHFTGKGDNAIPKKPTWKDNAVWINPSQRFEGVSEEVWNFHIGGYQVCEKWLKDRKGRTLSDDDIAHYQKIVVALSETIRLMGEIDEVIEEHGGWPNAFLQQKDYAVEPDRTAGVKTVMTSQTLFPEDVERNSSESNHSVKADEPQVTPVNSGKLNDHDAGHNRTDELDIEEIICLIRQLFGNGDALERDMAITALAQNLGYQRTSHRIYEELDNNLRTAVRRGIIENRDNGLAILARSIGEYDRNFLKDQFLASLQGIRWEERDEAIRDFARWMGFRRTGLAIDETVRSLINGLIREGRLESEGQQIRKIR